MSNARFHWRQASEIGARTYVCGHCGSSLSSNDGYTKAANPDGSGGTIGFLYICHHCNKPTYFEGNTQIPGARPGDDVKGITDSGVELLYKEVCASRVQALVRECAVKSLPKQKKEELILKIPLEKRKIFREVY